MPVAPGQKPWTDYRSEAVLHRELRKRGEHSNGRETWMRNPSSYGADGSARAPWGDAHRPHSRDLLASGDFARIAFTNSVEPLAEIAARPPIVRQPPRDEGLAYGFFMERSLSLPPSLPPSLPLSLSLS
eukprot:COSAG03_NODE_11002_length_617_cov_1.129344_2_plen_128_part_01